MTVAVEHAVLVSLELSCCAHAEEVGEPLYQQLRHGYELCSVLTLPSSLDEWRDEHRTARKRVDRCRRRGYRFGPLQRENWADGIHAVNVSKEVRQGRPMSAGYRKPPANSPLPHYPCARHAIRTWGVWSRTGELAAYLTMYRAGDLALVSQILGHGDHLDNEVMWLLFAGALEREVAVQPGFVIYNRHDSGEAGLRWWKEHVGFTGQRVEWLP